MSGVTKHIYNREISEKINIIGKMIQSIKDVLPKTYVESDIIENLEKYYPYEIEGIKERLEYYRTKEHHLKNRGLKSRYPTICIRDLIRHSPVYVKIMTCGNRAEYEKTFDEEKQRRAILALEFERKPINQRIEAKINKGKAKVQCVTPEFIDKMIGLYERKHTSQKDRVYILQELKKYYCRKVVQFFYKLVDTEINNQLRWEAFFHLQEYNFHPRARRQKYIRIQTKNKKNRLFLKKEYPNQYTTIEHTPQELEYRINNSKEQQIKTFDYFICHSSKDFKAVQNLITYENSLSRNVFCDWISDRDYLKRHLLCKETLEVINRRLEQSKSLIFVVSENSIDSVWCMYELNYFFKLGKQLYQITVEEISKESYTLSNMTLGAYQCVDFEQCAIEFGDRLFDKCMMKQTNTLPNQNLQSKDLN